MPAPLSVRVSLGWAVIVNPLPPELKLTLSTSTGAETEIPRTLEMENVAMSVVALGTVAGVQLPAVFQSPLLGLRFQVALPA